MKHVIRFLFLLLCLTRNVGISEASEDGAANKILIGSSIYVYSFLDLFPKSYTPPVTDQIVNDLRVKFSDHLVTAKFLEFRKSKIGKTYPLPRVPPVGEVSMNVPISAVVFANMGEEAYSKSKYRMIIFPKNFKNEGAWRYYDIDCKLEDIESGKVIWEYTYHGSHMSILSNSENKEKRSKKITDSVINDLKISGFIK